MHTCIAEFIQSALHELCFRSIGNHPPQPHLLLTLPQSLLFTPYMLLIITSLQLHPFITPIPSPSFPALPTPLSLTLLLSSEISSPLLSSPLLSSPLLSSPHIQSKPITGMSLASGRESIGGSSCFPLPSVTLLSSPLLFLLLSLSMWVMRWHSGGPQQIRILLGVCRSWSAGQ